VHDLHKINQLADTSVPQLIPLHAHKASRMIRCSNISIPHVDLGRNVLLAWRCNGTSRCLFVKKMHACIKLSFNTEQKKVVTGEKEVGPNKRPVLQGTFQRLCRQSL
jgi:hypothetical protein